MQDARGHVVPMLLFNAVRCTSTKRFHSLFLGSTPMRGVSSMCRVELSGYRQSKDGKLKG